MKMSFPLSELLHAFDELAFRFFGVANCIAVPGSLMLSMD